MLFLNPLNVGEAKDGAFGRGGNLAVWTVDGKFKIYHHAAHSPFQRPHPVPGKCVGVSMAALERSGAAINDEGVVTVFGMPDHHPLCSPYGGVQAPDVSALALSQDGRLLACGDRTGLLRLWAPNTAKTKPFSTHLSLKRITALSFDPRGWLYAADAAGIAYCYGGLQLLPNMTRFLAHKAELNSLNGPDGLDELPGDFEVYSLAAQPEGPDVVLAGTGNVAYLLRMTYEQTQNEEGQVSGGIKAMRVSRLQTQFPDRPDAFIHKVEFLDQGTFALHGETGVELWYTNPSSGDAARGHHLAISGYKILAVNFRRGSAGNDAVDVAISPIKAKEQKPAESEHKDVPHSA